MEIDESKNVSIIDNTIITSLTHFYTSIRLINGTNGAYFCLKVIDSDMNKREYNFYTLEEAVYLKNRLKKCITLEDVDKLYNNLISIDDYIKPSSPIKIEDNKTFLSEKDFKTAIINYYNQNNTRITVRRKTTYKVQKWNIKFYKVSHYELDGKKKVHQKLLTENDIKSILDELLESEDYELVDYSYVTENTNPAYTPYFHGVSLNLKQREKPKRLDLRRL